MPSETVIIEATLREGDDVIAAVFYELRRLPVRLLQTCVEPCGDGIRLSLLVELDSELGWYCEAMLERIPGVLAVEASGSRQAPG